MKKTAFLAVLLAMLLPLAGYFLIKYYSKDAVIMPARYFPDSTFMTNGKPDTTWHQVQGPKFTNQFGKTVQLSDYHGKIIVMSFFFSRCPTICPGLTKNLKKMQDSFTKNDGIVQFVSVSIDPEHDSTKQLRAFADRFKVNHDTWDFLTGNKEEIYSFAINEMKANIADPGVDTAFIHTEKFFLLDTNRVIRGFYNGFDTTALALLAHDIPTLMLERTKNSPSVFREFIPILPLIFMGIAFVFIIIIILERKRRKE